MSRRWLHGSVLLWLFISLFGVAGDSSNAQDVCDGAQKELEQERERLTDYESALRESYENRDTNLTRVLNFKISQAKKKLRDLELIIKYCPSRASSLPEVGLSGPKSDDGRYADKNCSELKKMLFPLIVSKRQLERRKKSMLSTLTEEDEAELQKVSDELRHVRKALKTRCSTERTHRSLLKRLRR